MSVRFCATAAALAGLASSALAVPELPPVVVTATRQETRVNELVVDASVIERQEILQAGSASTLGELLSRQPGIEYSRAGMRGAPETVFIRGTNSGHAVVLVDGMRVGSATLGQTTISNIPLQQIERVEILRGSASSLYGSDAIGGVINIITVPEGAPRLAFDAGFGNYDTQAASISGGGKSERWLWNMRLGGARSDGANAVTDQSSAAYNADHDGYWQGNATANAELKVAPNAKIGARHFSSKVDNQFDTDFPSSDPDWQTINRVVTNGLYAKLKPASKWQSNFQLSRSEDENITRPTATFGMTGGEDRFKTRRDQMSWQNDIELPLGKMLALLERTEEEVMTSIAYDQTERDVNSLALGWNANIGAHRWQANVRRDNSSQYDAEDTYTAGYGYQLSSQWRVFGSVGTGFKAPSFNDLYFPSTPFSASNPNLLPESSKNREISIRHEAGNQQTALTYFDNKIKNLIAWQGVPVGPTTVYSPFNVGEARIQGGSLSHEHRWQALSLRATYNYQDPEDQKTGKRLALRAKQFGTIAAGWTQGVWDTGVEWQLIGDRYADTANTDKMGGYNLVNIRGSYKVDPSTTLFARVDNLLDKEYEQTRSFGTHYATLGTAVFAGVRYEMK